jgi:hypothetical protein
MSLMMGPLAGCADLGSNGGAGGMAGVGGAGPSSKIITVECRNSVTDATSPLAWELTVTVSAVSIESGELFPATLDGVVVFNESFLDLVQDMVPGGVQKANLVDLKATVHVRSGATGDDVTLTSELSTYECLFSSTECDPANDLPGVPGDVGNTDCEPEADTNPCGRSVLLPTSTDCDSGGVCSELRKTGPESQCSDNGFCITGDLRLQLERDLGEYRADSQGNVLFGWADESTGATIEVMPKFEDPTGPIGLRVGVGPVLVALECVMGASTPDSALISFPIHDPSAVSPSQTARTNGRPTE